MASAVNADVIGPTEAMLHVANLVGDRFGGMAYHEKLLAIMQAIVRWNDRVGSQLPTAFNDPGSIGHPPITATSNSCESLQ
jgi:hypothetical protein